MGKKRSRDADGRTAAAKDADRMDEDSDEDFDIVNVEFEWFNFDAEVDFHGTKTLLRQLLDVDSLLFDMSALVDIILAQSTIGSTIKVDGKANDAYALLTALSLRELRDKPVIAALTQYLAEKAAAQVSGPPALATALPALLATQQQPPASSTTPHIGLVLSERLINMPAEVAPPLFSMLIDEVEAAVEDGEPYEFTHYLILSKTYQEEQSSLAVVTEDDETSSHTSGKRKKARTSGAASSSSSSSPIFYFHPEDEVLQRHALAYGTFPFTKEDDNVADSKRAFQDIGVKTYGSMILIEASKFAGAVQAIKDYLKPPQ